MKIALVHDFLTQYGGAERFLEALALCFDNQVDIYTLTYDHTKFPAHWKGLRITSVASSLPKIDVYPQIYAPYLVSVMERLDLSSYDVVITSDVIFSKFVICPPQVVHISYMHTPAQTLYGFLDEQKRSIKSSLVSMFQKSFLRNHEYIAVQRIDRLLTNSHTTADRMASYYKRKATVIYSFVDVPEQKEFAKVYSSSSDYFICLSRLVRSKRVDLAVRACNELKVKLVIVGEGSERSYLESIAGETITFVGYVDDTKRNLLIAQSKGLIFPGFEDFGLAPLEVMAWGKPVIAYAKGGVCESVVDGQTGIFFEQQTVDAVVGALQRFSTMKFNPEACRLRASDFSRSKFNLRIKSIVDEAVANR